MDGAVTNPPSAMPQAELDRITDDLVMQFKTVFDPEIPVDVYELGLIYKVDLNDDGHVDIDMTLTAPGCPVAGEMPGWVEEGALKVSRARRGIWCSTRRGRPRA